MSRILLALLLLPIMPRAAPAQVRQSSGDCDYSVEVPAYTTGVVGTSVDWPMEYCHTRPGKPPAEIDWTVAANHCSELHPAPGSGRLTVHDGECREVPVSIPIPNDVCARSDATLNNASDGCDKHHEASGKLCILPTGEHSVHTTNQTGWADFAYFYGHVEPLTADFSGRVIRERRLSIDDTCYRSGVPGSVSYKANGDFLNDGIWTIVSSNRYGAEDRIGGGGLFPLTAPRYDACVVVAEQAMEMQCGDGQWHRYHVNTIRIQLPTTGHATVWRDNANSN